VINLKQLKQYVIKKQERIMNIGPKTLSSCFCFPTISGILIDPNEARDETIRMKHDPKTRDYLHSNT